jgi:hypothetical protein
MLIDKAIDSGIGKRRRPIVEKSLSRITAYRPIAVRYEHHINVFLACLSLARFLKPLTKSLNQIFQPVEVTILLAID